MWIGVCEKEELDNCEVSGVAGCEYFGIFTWGVISEARKDLLLHNNR
jgi:hypothetical protein